MFDIGWSEMLLVAVVAIVVVGPKDLPDMLRNLGRGMRAMRRMASDFQGQFNEALREAELDDVRNEFTKLRSSTRNLTRLPDIQSIARDEIKNAIEGTAQAATTEPVASPLPSALPEAQLPEMREPVIETGLPATPESPKRKSALKTAKAKPRVKLKSAIAKADAEKPRPVRKPRAKKPGDDQA